MSGGIQCFATSAFSDETGTMSFAPSNPALGTLNGVTVSLLQFQGGVLVTAATIDGFFGTVQAAATPFMTLSVGAQGLIAGGYTASASCELRGLGSMLCSQQGESQVPIGGSFQPATALLPNSLLTPFTGPNAVQLTAAIADLGFSTSLVDLLAFGASNTSRATALWGEAVEMTYSYIDMPEPASLALLGTALGLAALLRHRRG